MTIQADKKKKQIKKILRKKVHHNRWLIWAIVFSIVSLTGLASYIQISDLNIESDTTPYKNFESWHGYRDARLGFALRYPRDWSIEVENSTTVNFVPPDMIRDGVTVSVLVPKNEKAIRSALDIFKEEPVIIGNLKATRIFNAIAGRGYESVVLLKTDKKLFVIRGVGSLVDQILLTFKPI
jgi:hypothetical protein